MVISITCSFMALCKYQYLRSSMIIQIIEIVPKLSAPYRKTITDNRWKWLHLTLMKFRVFSAFIKTVKLIIFIITENQ